MARKVRSSKSGFKLTGVTAYIERVSQKVAEQAAFDIIANLKTRGPYWTGEFEKAWVAIPGDNKRIPAQLESDYDIRERIAIGPLPRPSGGFSKPVIAPLRGTGLNSYTIGNLMKYRNIALDLVPGRYTENKNNTARQDWYVQYIEGGGLVKTLKEATGKVAQDPKVTGYKGLADARGRLGL
jgi:hypothetical protein